VGFAPTPPELKGELKVLFEGRPVALGCSPVVKLEEGKGLEDEVDDEGKPVGVDIWNPVEFGLSPFENDGMNGEEGFEGESAIGGNDSNKVAPKDEVGLKGFIPPNPVV